MLQNPWIFPWPEAFSAGAFTAHPLARFEREVERMLRGDRAPALDVWTGETEARVALNVPGFAPEEVQVTLDGDVLSIEGSRAAKALGPEDRWHLREREVERFQRSVRLPFRVEANEVEARHEHGVLWIKLPRAHAERPKKITVRTQA